MFYLTMHSTHFIYRLYDIRHRVKDLSDKERKEGNVLFNDALNTFYLRLYGVVRHRVKDHTEREETLCCHRGYSFRLAARVLLYAPSQTG